MPRSRTPLKKRLKEIFYLSRIDQGTVIDNINKYLAVHKRGVTLDEKGVCSGLSSIYIQYALRGKEGEFY